MKYKLLSGIALLTIVLTISSCGSGEPQPLEEILRGPVETQLNLYKRAPLGALLTFSTQEDCTVEYEVAGKIPVGRTFTTASRYHQVPVIGLYPGTVNTVRLTLTTGGGRVYTGEVQVKTNPLPDYMPSIEIAKLDRARMEPGFHLVDMLIANNGRFLAHTFLFDDNGDIRWLMDMSETGQITYTTYRLRNGNWLYLNWIDLLEVDDLGKEVKREQMWGHAGNHEVIELSDGTLLMGGSKKDAKIIRDGNREVATRFDFAIIWDREQNRTVKEWDLRQVLDVDRMVYPPDYTLDFEADWFHLNSIDRDEDGSLVLSGRNQGVLKVDADNQLQWILAPHRSWGKAGFDGSGLQTSDYLLTAVDANGKPYPPAVQEGREGAEDFEWPTGQHAVNILENGNLLLFDNGLMRNFDPTPTYSRAVEYRIDEEKKTIQQVWAYGKARGLEMYSPITSDVDVLPRTGNRLIVSGNVRLGDLPPHGQLTEVTYPAGEEVFEARIFFKDALGTKAKAWGQFDLVFRGERYELMPGG